MAKKSASENETISTPAPEELTQQQFADQQKKTRTGATRFWTPEVQPWQDASGPVSRITRDPQKKATDIHITEENVFVRVSLQNDGKYLLHHNAGAVSHGNTSDKPARLLKSAVRDLIHLRNNIDSTIREVLKLEEAYDGTETLPLENPAALDS